MVLCLPLPGLIVKFLQSMQREVMKKTDARVSAVTESAYNVCERSHHHICTHPSLTALSILRMVKLFGWEQKMSDQISGKRAAEMEWVRKREFAALANTVMSYLIPILVMISSYATFTLVMKRDLSPSIVFSSITIFDMLRDNLEEIVSFRITSMIQGKVSLDRVTEFLHNVGLASTR